MTFERTRVTESRHAVARYMYLGPMDAPAGGASAVEARFNVWDEYTVGELLGEIDNEVDVLRTMIETGNEGGMWAQGFAMVESATALLMNVMEKCGLPAHPESARAFALGVYSEQEGSMADDWETSDGDRWRDEPLHEPGRNTDILRHLEHEVEEIRRNVERGELDYLLHNAADLLGQSAILRAKIHADFDDGGESDD